MAKSGIGQAFGELESGVQIAVFVGGFALLAYLLYQALGLVPLGGKDTQQTLQNELKDLPARVANWQYTKALDLSMPYNQRDTTLARGYAAVTDPVVRASMWLQTKFGGAPKYSSVAAGVDRINSGVEGFVPVTYADLEAEGLDS